MSRHFFSNKFFADRENSSQESKDSQDKVGRRGLEDQDRDRAVYCYLLTLTDLGIEDEDEKSKPNESYIAKQWGLEDNRIFVRRVLRSVLQEKYYSDEKHQAPPGLTLGKLVKILAALEQYWLIRRLETPEGKVPRILTRVEKWRALQTFWQLSSDERTELNLPTHSGELLLQQLLMDATDPIKGLSKDGVTALYQTFINQQPLSQAVQVRKKDGSSKFHSKEDRLDAYNTLNKQISAERETLILETIEYLIEEHYVELDDRWKTDKLKELYDKVLREISRFEYQAGLRQIKPLIGKEIVASDVYPLTSEFIERLTHSIVENEILTEEFPIYLKFFEIEKLRPLPLYVKEEDQGFGLLNAQLLDKAERETIRGLEQQVVYKVKVYFYIHLPDNYTLNIKDIQIGNDRRLHFYQEIKGIGSPISHIIAAINRVLLWDIPCLTDYLPTVKQVFLNSEAIGKSDDSPVWSHSVVKLCKKADVDRAIREGKNYEVVDTNQVLAYGDACGFDLVEVTAKASLNARLRAIKQTGVSSKTYIAELCNRIAELEALRHAKNLVKFYPFSLRAMEGYLNATIFREGKYRFCDQKYNFKEEKASHPWSLVAYDAHLTLIEAYLREGLHRCAKRYLDILEPHLQKFETTISSLMYARYYLYLFQYRFLADLDDEEYPYSDRYQAIQAAIESLDSAKERLNYRLKIHHIINELPQTNIRPFFNILSKIYANRAKLYISFSTYANKVGDAWDTLVEPVRLLEKARIHSARDGNPADYAYQSAFQSWAYLMIAYLWDHHRLPQPNFSREECIDWARRLADHALICYSSTGRLCYQQLKNNAGRVADQSSSGQIGRLSSSYDAYGRTKVQLIPFIQELSESDACKQKYTPRVGGEPIYDVLELDLSILKQVDHFNEDKSKYLFGTYSSILLFAMGMLELCEEQHEENLLSRIKQALRMFTYCWAIAEDGVKGSLNEDQVILNRIFESPNQERFPDSLLQGLYPHRINRMTDLGKIFMAVCKQLIVLSHSQISKFYQSELDWNEFYQLTVTEWQDINHLIGDLHDADAISGIAQTLKQKRYNGQLADHYEKIQHYFSEFEKQLKLKKIGFTELVQARDKVVKDIFKLIRGESGVNP